MIVFAVGMFFEKPFAPSAYADSASSAVYGDEGSVDNSSNFSITVEELNALELRLSDSDLVLDLNPTSDAPVFGSRDLSVTVYTTNVTGYYLTMTPSYQSVATTNLTRTEQISGAAPTISTLASATAPATFSSSSDTTTANKWGYKVNTTNLSTVDTTVYHPTSTTAMPLNKTNAPLNTGDETDITFAAKVDADTPAGSYKVDLTFTAVTNANTYGITFNSGTGSSDASLANMPSPNPQTGALESGTSTNITISSSTPTRTGYSFLGWCSVSPTTSNNTDSCSGTTYQPSDSITIYTDTPDITLYAMWGINSYAITITNSNTTSSVSNLTIPYGGSATVTVTPASNYYLSDVSCPSGYTCSGYNTGTSYTSQQTVTVTNNGTTSGGTLSFTGTISIVNIGNMQNLSYSKCTTTAAYVTDTRDNQQYTIQRLADGNCWMMTNLNLGATDLTTDLTSANTNLSSTVTASTFNGWKKSSGSGTYTAAEYIPLTASNTSNGLDTDPTSGTAYGTLYNYCAASAGTICTSGNSSNTSSYDLCPAGWRLPTSNTGGEFATLYANASYNTNAKMRASVANGGAAFALAGIFYNSTPMSQGSSGYYWSSTRYDRTRMYHLSVGTSSVNPSNYSSRDYGSSIRCILKDTLQDFSSSDFSSMTVGTTTTLRDARTGMAYRVKMISLNGTKTLWMMSNLKLPGGTVLTTSNSNVTSSYTLPSDTGSSGWVNDFCKPYMATAGGEYYYYNWSAATARTNSTSSTSGGCSNDTSNSVGDICPKGWRLPVYSGEVDNSTWLSNLQANGSLTATGTFYSGSQYDVGSYGNWWTSTRDGDSSARYLCSRGGTAYASNYYKSTGLTVRCMRTS